ncbi:MAG: 2-oxo acid dehydrogenase subunit E2, partial [Alphaproteobacteria bacterium]|nr:2-oxo acid dehydrogenase subunit E2 [Alphaproteobacteria bacterium]
GDTVRREQPLLEVATDKADSVVPCPADGTVVTLTAKEGDIVPTGGLLCTLQAGAAAAIAPSASPASKAAPSASNASEKPSGPALSTPSTRKLAREEGVDLAAVKGTGENGKVTREDVLRAASAPIAPVPHVPGAPPALSKAELEIPVVKAPVVTSAAADIAALIEAPVPGVGFRSYKVPAYAPAPGDEVVPFNRRRRITADHMVYSQHVSPHVVAVAEIDMQKVSKLRDQHKKSFERDGIPLTFLSFVAAATVRALREFPVLNARVLEDSYVKLRDINVGVAVDTPGGLLVASVKNADQLSMRGLARNIDELATRARDGKITADDLRGTSFTISNPGRKGNLFGGAIISQPNVAILRIGEIKKRAVVVTEDGEDRIAIHPVMYAALSYDHRIVDGVEANAFLWRVSDVLQRAELEIG